MVEPDAPALLVVLVLSAPALLVLVPVVGRAIVRAWSAVVAWACEWRRL